jgi:uncharacterized protein
MKRVIEEEILAWKNQSDRKVLLLRGARQVGKTYTLRQIGKTFSNFLEVNFEEEPRVKSLFSDSLNPKSICEKLSIFYGKKIEPGETLLFLDEIQSCPDALKSLRFFYEKMPELHVAAAGSLLEMAISEISTFGVGRIHPLFMYPLSFMEFLVAANQEKMTELISTNPPGSPVDTAIHLKIMEKLRIFCVIGGLPDVVKAWIEKGDFNACQQILDDLITAYHDDFAKYERHTPVLALNEVFQAFIRQAGGKFKYSETGGGSAYHYKNALELLVKAGLAYQVFHTAGNGLPLASQVKLQRFKMLIFDTGIFQRLSALNLADYMSTDSEALQNSGVLAELHTGNEIIKNQPSGRRSELYYWHREAKSSNAELDYLLAVRGRIVPVEVKAGTRGSMQSMRRFLDEHKIDFGIRCSGENYSLMDRICVLPLYAAGTIPDISLPASK